MSEEKPAPAAPARRFSDEGLPPSTLIGTSMHLKGELSGDGSVDVAGAIDGNCRISGLCRVREGARVSGDITASSIIVQGQVTGRLLAAERVEIGPAGVVRADIRAKVVAIAEGALFEGSVDMEGGEGPAAPTSFREKRRR
jgi:cytoskeletal protein CcmA (bactofilin family)